MNSDPILEVLREIREEARTSNVRLESLENRVGLLREETRLLAERLGEMGHRQVASELRLSTEVLTLADVTRQVRDLISVKLDDHKQVLDHERRLSSLEERVNA
jgi:hypothetical protein